MTPKEIKALVKTLRSCGVTHWKTPEIELNLAPLAPRETKPKLVPIEAPIVESEKIEHKVEELKSLLKLSDDELVDRLFPEPIADETFMDEAN